jgi:ABC-2 type transport system permease protein
MQRTAPEISTTAFGSGHESPPRQGSEKGRGYRFALMPLGGSLTSRQPQCAFLTFVGFPRISVVDFARLVQGLNSVRDMRREGARHAEVKTFGNPGHPCSINGLGFPQDMAETHPQDRRGASRRAGPPAHPPGVAATRGASYPTAMPALAMTGPAGASARRVWGLMYRHLALYRRSWPRLLELAYWPVLQMCIWGFTASFLAARMGNPAVIAGATLLGGVLLWEVALRSQMGVAISFLEEMWSRNLGHVFVSPMRPWELVAALILMSVIRMAAGVAPAILVAWALYAYNLFALGPVVVLFFINLMIMGWAVALGVVSLILRHGAGAEALAWSVLFGLTPFSAVFYPVSVLPAALRPIALALPSAHVFEGMRGVLFNGAVGWDHLVAAFALNAVWLAGAALLFARQFRQARLRGALMSIGE